MGDEKGMKNVMSAERAQELLAAADTAGRWTLARARDAGTYEVRSDPGDRPVTGWGRVVQYRGDAALMAAAPELAESVVALHNELRIEQVTSDGLREDRDELRAELSAVRAALREALDDPSGQYSADGAELVSLVKLLDARHKAARREEGKATAKVVKVAAERDELRVENERLRGRETTNRKDSEPRKRSKRKREPEDPKLQDRTVLSDEVYRMKYGEDKPRDW